jgi:hypothetical protein
MSQLEELVESDLKSQYSEPPEAGLLKFFKLACRSPPSGIFTLEVEGVGTIFDCMTIIKRIWYFS